VAYSVDFLSKNGKILDMEQEALFDTGEEIKGLLTREEAKEITDVVLIFHYDHPESKRIADKFPVTDDNLQGRLASLGAEIFIYLRGAQLDKWFERSEREEMEHGLTKMEPRELIFRNDPEEQILTFWR